MAVGSSASAVAVAATPAVASAVAELHDETRHDAVDDDARVEAGASERDQARDGDRGERRVEPHGERNEHRARRRVGAARR